MKRLKKLTRNQKEFLVRKLGVESKNYLVERNTSEFTVFFNIKTSEKIIYHKTFDSIIEEKDKEINNLKKNIEQLEAKVK